MRLLSRSRWLPMVAALAGVALAACSGAGLDEPDEPGHEAPPSQAQATPVPPPPGAVDGEPDGRAAAPAQAQAQPQPQPQPLPPAPGQPPIEGPSTVPVLGAPCSPAAQLPIDPCGSKGRVALAIDPRQARLARVPSCPLVSVDPKAFFATQACVGGDEIFVVEGCAMCRVPGAGWSAHGRIAEMTDAQHLHLQKQVGLPTSKPYRTAALWRSALGARASQK